MIERQVRYNFETDPGEQEPARHRWIFLIINEPRETARIRNRIYEQLQPIVDLRELDQCRIKNSRGLQYTFFCFSSPRSSIDTPSRVYKSEKLTRDRDLFERDEIGLAEYIRGIIEGRR